MKWDPRCLLAMKFDMLESISIVPSDNAYSAAHGFHSCIVAELLLT